MEQKTTGQHNGVDQIKSNPNAFNRAASRNSVVHCCLAVLSSFVSFVFLFSNYNKTMCNFKISNINRFSVYTFIWAKERERARKRMKRGSQWMSCVMWWLSSTAKNTTIKSHYWMILNGWESKRTVFLKAGCIKNKNRNIPNNNHCLTTNIELAREQRIRENNKKNTMKWTDCRLTWMYCV